MKQYQYFVQMNISKGNRRPSESPLQLFSIPTTIQIVKGHLNSTYKCFCNSEKNHL